MYCDLSANFSTESLILVKRHQNYLVECGQNSDPDALIAIVASTHHNEIGGHIILRKHYMRERKEIEFGLLKVMSEMDLASFYKKFVEFRATIIKQGHPVPEEGSAEIFAETKRSVL